MTTDTKAKITGAVATVGGAIVGGYALGWKAALVAGGAALFSWLGGLFHSTPGAK